MSFEMSKFAAATKQVLTRDDILNEISSDVSRVQLHLEVDSFHSLALLLKFKWDIGALKESFHASQDLSDFLVSNNVTQNSASAPINTECQVCLAVEDVKGLECRHMACGLCWKEYLKTKIESGNPAIECFDCPLLFCNDRLKPLLRKSELLSSYQELIVNSYVESTSYLSWCSKNCGNVLRRAGSNIVSCSCGAKFCFQCKLDSHTPASCDQMRQWERECEDHKELGRFADKQSWEWIQNNTQDCPKCWAPIQKNGGCNHMSCEKCKHMFCWNCRRNCQFDYHGYDCKYPKATIVRPKLEKIASYLVPFNYQKQKLENTNDSSLISECRRVLMYSYVYAYYQESGKIMEHFEQFQKELRDQLDMEKFKQNLQKCEQLRNSILDYCISSQTGKKVGKKKTKDCCYIINRFIIVGITKRIKLTGTGSRVGASLFFCGFEKVFILRILETSFRDHGFQREERDSVCQIMLWELE